jgi:hypothetical protein
MLRDVKELVCQIYKRLCFSERVARRKNVDITNVASVERSSEKKTVSKETWSGQETNTSHAFKRFVRYEWSYVCAIWKRTIVFVTRDA